MHPILLLTFMIESITIFLRLSFGSVRHFYPKRLPRIHHGYIGAALLILNLAIGNYALNIAGWALLLSDAIHHFIVLPLWVGRTEFP